MQIRHIFRWDLDKTYLKTEFDTVRDIVRTARLTAEERENIPGSAALIHAIRNQDHPQGKHLVYFISGSPQQLRPVLEKKFALDGFKPDGFSLKPTMRNLLRGRFRAVRGQVAYKLHQLIQGRSEAPIGSNETLFGDDAESDAFIYSLYADTLAGRVDEPTLIKVLKKAGAYQDQIKEIQAGLESIIHEDRVQRIIIHLDQQTPPITFLPYFPLVVPIYNHLQTALVLYLDGTLEKDAVFAVAKELLGKHTFEAQKLVLLSEDILRRRRLHYPVEELDRLANDLKEVEPPADSKDGSLDEQTMQMLKNVAQQAEHLRDRPAPPEGTEVSAERGLEPGEKRDYLKLFEQENQRRDDAKKAKKVAAAKPAKDS